MSDDYDMNDLLQRVKHALEEMSWGFSESPDGPFLRMNWSGTNGFHSCFLQVDDERPVISFYSQAQCRVPEEKRLAMAEFLNRANCKIWVGHFEVDFADGEVRYRTVLNIADGVLTTRMLAALMYPTVHTSDDYLPGIMGVVWNDLSAEDAIGLCDTE